MRAYSYARWSSIQQTDGHSLRRLTDLAAAYAAKHELTLDNSTYLDAGISTLKGKNLVEGKLGAFLKAIDGGYVVTPCYLLVEALDRITRGEIDEAMELFLSIIRRGVTIVVLQPEQEFSRATIKTDKGISLIIAIAMLVQGHEARDKRGKCVKAAWDKKRELQKVGVKASKACPAWLTLSEDRRKFITNTSKASVVKRIFKMAIEGNGILAISKKLNDEGVLTIGKRRIRNEAGILVDREDGFWTTGMVGNLFRQEAVFGRWREDKDRKNYIDDYYPVIVSKKDFDRVTVGRDKRKGGGGGFTQGTSNLFSGLTRCAYCGGPLKYKSNSRKNDYYKSVLVCRKSEANACEWTQHMPYASMEIEIIINLMIYTRRVIELQTMDQTSESQRNTYDQLILEKQTILERLGEIAANSKVDIVVIADRLEKEQMEMDKLMDERAKLNGSQVTEEEMNDHLKILDELYRKPDMITTDNSNRALRLQIQTSLRRQIKKIEVAPGIEDHPKYYKHFDLKKRPKRTPCHMVKMSYLDGTDEVYEIHHGLWDTDESGAPI